MAELSRRDFFASSAVAGVAGAAGAMGLGATAAAPAAAAIPAGANPTRALPDVWGADFLDQWSAPDNLKRDLTTGSALIRLSGQMQPGLSNKPDQDWDAILKFQHDNGWSGMEVWSANWLGRKWPDSEIRAFKAAQAKHDVIFYNIHCAGNIIAPDPGAEYWQRHIIEAIHSAEEFGVPMILTHTGSMYPSRDVAHPRNWSKESWDRSVKALKRICKDTAGSKVDIAIEPVNTEVINNPWAQKRLREEVGDPRICSGLDITNMVSPQVAFRMSEMIDLTFDLLEDQIRYIHAKDFVWNGMMAGLDWALQGTGNMDYELFLARISRLKLKEVFVLVEFLRGNEDYVAAQRNIRTIANKVGVKIHGTQGAAA
jgi:sugar phosphate isomerase/epimerase